MPDIITVGSATIDVFVYTEKAKLIWRKDKEFLAYPLGSKLLIDRICFSWGGGGTNTAVAIARLGMKAGYFGCVGNDDNGSKIKKLLAAEKVAFLGKTRVGMSSYSVVLDSIAHDRTVLTYKGVNERLTKGDVPKTLACKWLYFSSLTGQSYAVLEKLVAYAKPRGIKIAFNPSTYLAEKGKAYLAKVLKATDLLVLNKEEAGLIVGNSSIKEMLHKLSMLGPATVVITDGPKGIYSFDGKDYYHAAAHNIRVVESTGAGDAFASTFLVSMIRTGSIVESLKWGMTNAESVIQHLGAKEKLLTPSELKREMKKRPVVVRKI